LHKRKRYDNVNKRKEKDMANTLMPNQRLNRNESITSPNEVYKLLLQNDGNLVLLNMQKKWGDPLWNKPLPIWDAGTNPFGSHVIMQDDGNLVVFGDTKKLWASGTGGKSGAYLEIQNDGNLVIYLPRYSLWKTNTVGK
jgi:hypothetical protein